MSSAVRASSMALRILWIVNVVLGVYIAYLAKDPGPWLLTHMFTGIIVVMLLWFLGVAQGLVKGGSLALTSGTFVVGLALALIGMAQPSVTNIAGLRTLQGAHIILMLATIALGEISASRYRKGATPVAQG